MASTSFSSLLQNGLKSVLELKCWLILETACAFVFHSALNCKIFLASPSTLVLPDPTESAGGSFSVNPKRRLLCQKYVTDLQCMEQPLQSIRHQIKILSSNRLRFKPTECAKQWQQTTAEKKQVYRNEQNPTIKQQQLYQQKARER